MPLRRLDTANGAIAWLRGRGVRALAADSRRVGSGDAFIAWPGYAVDGRRFVEPALRAGAVAALVEAEGVDAFGFEANDAVAALPGLKAATGTIASGFLGAPSERLQVVAVTGTNGKTSSAWWIAQALSLIGRRCGVIGTLGIGEPPNRRDPGAQVVSTGLTTPDPVTLHAAFRGFADAGFVACAIEASSIGVAEHRLEGTRIAVALFTNFTQDHLDYHGSMQAYWQAKEALFAWPGLRAAVVNLDDPKGAALVATAAQRSLEVWTTSLHGEARLRAAALRYENGGLAFEVHEAAASATVRSMLIGDYNAANLLGVIGVMRALGVPLASAAAACADLTPVPGRMQRVPSHAGAPAVVVDYAHTPDALDKALQALAPFVAERGGALWCVFGCGGDRDPGKRPQMGAIARRLAKRVVVTSDNPRSEEAPAIVAQILAGIEDRCGVEAIVDRRAAIVHAVAAADGRDVILVAGKGHEDYQEVAGVRHPFSDVGQAQAALVSRGGRTS